jgi:methionyl-tRNA formyltransferase
MRIILNGQQAFGKAVLEALLDRGEDVVGVFCAPDKGGRPDPLKELTVERGLPLFQPPSYKDPAVWEEMRSLAPDLGVMAFVTLFVPQEALDIPTHGTIQYHPSLLPLHRGPSSINWPIIMGETRTGLTIFWPDDGLDEGPILMQKEVEIGPDDTLGTIYFDQLFPLGVEAMLESIDLVKAGNAPKSAQDHAKATYESWCRKENVALDWSKPAQQVHNMIRGADPAPGAWTTFNGEELQLFASTMTEGPSGAPGEVTDISTDGITIAAANGQLRVGRIRPQGGKKVPAAEFASESGLAKGAKLGG